MNLTKLAWLLLLMCSASCGYYIYTQIDGQKEQQVAIDETKPLFTAKDITTTSYNLDGVRSYTLNSAFLEHFTNTDETHFSQPLLHTFKQGITQEWRVTADKAVLKDKHILQMTGNVQIHNLLPTTQLKSIATDEVTLNLSNRDFWINSDVLILGVSFSTRGKRGQGNFDSQHMELMEQVKTVYENKIN